jgi:hypothetical protein
MNQEWFDRVRALIDSDYDWNSEASHLEEDALVEAYVRSQVARSDAARLLVSLFDKERDRWYA